MSISTNVYRSKIWLQNGFSSIITSLDEKYAKTVSSLYNMTFEWLKFKWLYVCKSANIYYASSIYFKKPIGSEVQTKDQLL